MAAITGIIHFNNKPVPSDHITNMMKVLYKYPADDVRIWQKESVFLGCHNQWIIREAIGEKVPYFDYDRKLVITADAIIDNREELYSKLNLHISGIPDSQIILLAYDKWGEEAPKHLIGDFAFIIWDEKKHKLFGARDFSGARTLYFYSGEKRFTFSTIIKPLLALPYIEKKLNEEWLAEFLAIPTMVESADMTSTVYKSIYQVPPSHSISVEKGKVTLKRYCTIEVNEKLKLASDVDYIEAFHDVFQKAVTSRIRTHGKVGSHLSGGLDSGTVVSFAAKALKKENRQLHTFSYIPEDDFVDWTDKYYVPNETSFIKETVGYVGNIKENFLKFEGKNPLDEIDDFLDIMEMPYKFFENSFWLKGISETASQMGVKVLLNGARGNHSISWGSWRLTTDYYASLMKKLKWTMLFKELEGYTRNYRTGKSNILPIVAKKAFPIIERISRRSTNESGYQFPQFINQDIAHRTRVYEKLQENNIDLSGGASVGNLTEYRNNYYKLLYPWNKSGVANTKLSLRYSLWDRDPTNDLRVIKFCLSLPDEQYVKEGMERSFLRRATKGILPDKVRLNQNSRGLQGADVIHRMTPNWSEFMNDLHLMSDDKNLALFINQQLIKDSIKKLGNEPKPEYVFTDDFKILTRCLIVHKFLKNFN